MIVFLSIAVVVAVAYASVREGLLASVTTLFNVLFGGLICFSLFEPLANQLEDMFRGSFLAGYEDATSMVFLFGGTVALLRVISNNIASQELELPALVQQFGSIAAGAITGYLTAGFLACMLQTIPYGENFLGFDYHVDQGVPMRRYLPPDRVWLGLMQRAGMGAFDSGDSPPFDAEGTFTLRYAKLRRYKEVPQAPQ